MPESLPSPIRKGVAAALLVTPPVTLLAVGFWYALASGEPHQEGDNEFAWLALFLALPFIAEFCLFFILSPIVRFAHMSDSAAISVLTLASALQLLFMGGLMSAILFSTAATGFPQTATSRVAGAVVVVIALSPLLLGWLPVVRRRWGADPSGADD